MPSTAGLEQDRLRLDLHRAPGRGGELMALRSFLFAPGNHARRVEKALTLPADAVILDLEDAVAVSEKPATRELVVAAFGKPRCGRLYVRVNDHATEWCYADIVTIARLGLDG